MVSPLSAWSKFESKLRVVIFYIDSISQFKLHNLGKTLVSYGKKEGNPCERKTKFPSNIEVHSLFFLREMLILPFIETIMSFLFR